MNHRSLNKDRAFSQSDPPWWSRNPPLGVLKQDFRNQWATSEKLHPSLTLSMVWSQPQVAIWWIAATRLLQYWLHFSDPWALLGLNRMKNNAAWHTRQSGREPWIQAWGTCFLMRVYMQVWQKKRPIWSWWWFWAIEDQMQCCGGQIIWVRSSEREWVMKDGAVG